MSSAKVEALNDSFSEAVFIHFSFFTDWKIWYLFKNVYLAEEIRPCWPVQTQAHSPVPPPQRRCWCCKEDRVEGQPGSLRSLILAGSAQYCCLPPMACKPHGNLAGTNIKIHTAILKMDLYVKLLILITCEHTYGDKCLTGNRCLRPGPADSDRGLSNIIDCMLNRSVGSWEKAFCVKNCNICIILKSPSWQRGTEEFSHLWSWRWSEWGLAVPDVEARRRWRCICVLAGGQWWWQRWLCEEHLEKQTKSYHTYQHICSMYSMICTIYTMVAKSLVFLDDCDHCGRSCRSIKRPVKRQFLYGLCINVKKCLNLPGI